MPSNRLKLCNLCGKEEITGWSTHWTRKHPTKDKQELVPGTIPSEPWCGDWFEKLSSIMQEKYKATKDVMGVSTVEDSTDNAKPIDY